MISIMQNHFAMLNLSEKAVLTPESVREAFQQTRANAQTDAVAVQAAFEVLSSPAKRLAHLHEVKFGTKARSGAISEDLMGLFGRIGIALDQAQQLVARKSTAQSELARALLAGKILAVQETLETLAASVLEKMQALQKAAALWDDAIPPDAEMLAQLVQESAFLERWERQITQRRLELMG
jgi:hypothetical protein